MQMREIDKQTYRKRLNIVIVACVIGLTTLSLGISQATIYFFTDREGTHFWINVMGVVVSLFALASGLKFYKHHPFLAEVYYVWRLKQQINYIIRKQRKVEKAVANNDVTAIIIMLFYYQACDQLYRLDDNTITMGALTRQSNELNQKITELNLNVSAQDYSEELLKAF
jgi:6-phosphofructokinase